VQITAPFHNQVPEHTVVVLVDDLHLFTQTWYYSALSYPMLNDRLSTTFVLRDPDASPHTPPDPANKISTALQKRLLLPFGQVKGLYHKEIVGFSPDIKHELEKRMAIPIPSLQTCCESALDLMTSADALLPTAPAAALALYFRAFRAIHILIHGRTRRVLADVFFHAGIDAGRFAGQTGMTVRVVLRLKLVARCVLAYLKLGAWDDAAFWGMRSIHIMREAMDTDFEDFLGEVIGGQDVAMIYVRTGVAFWKMEREIASEAEGVEKWRAEMRQYEGEELGGSEEIWKAAGRFLKGRTKGDVRTELEGFCVPRRIVDLFRDEEKDDRSTMGVDGSGEE
jgi:hypothetical protein